MSDKLQLLSSEGDDLVVWGSSQSVTLSQEELAAVSGDAFIIKGDLVVTGKFYVDDGEQYKISGNVICDSFWIAEGLLECEDLIVKQHAELVVDYACLMESLEDVGSIKTQIVYCPYCPPDEIPASIAFEFAIDDSVEEEDKLAEMLGGNYKVVLEALQNGETIDDDWLSKH